MEPTVIRRGFLSKALSLLRPRGQDEPPIVPGREVEPDPWLPEGVPDERAFAWGLQIGDPTATGARMSLWSTEPAVEIVLARACGLRWEEVRRFALTLPEGRVQADLRDLEPDTVHAIVAVTPDGRRSCVTRFRTMLAPGASRKLLLAATCCAGKPNRPWPSMSAVAREKVDALLLLGDTVYADGAVTIEEYRRKWSDALAVRGLRDLTASTGFIATWDDHEVGDNWHLEELKEGQFEAAMQAWQEAIPRTGERCWRKLSFGKVADVFVLDCRGERRNGQYLSTEQLTWFEAGLRESTARFKLILNSVPITDYTAIADEIDAADRWQGFREQREEILRFITDNHVEGVLWLSGDLHFGMVGRVDPPGGTAALQWEVLVGPAGSMLNKLVLLVDVESSLQWDLFIAEWNTTLLELDPDAGTVHIRYVGDDGAVIAERLLEV